MLALTCVFRCNADDISTMNTKTPAFSLVESHNVVGFVLGRVYGIGRFGTIELGRRRFLALLAFQEGFDTVQPLPNIWVLTITKMNARSYTQRQRVSRGVPEFLRSGKPLDPGQGKLNGYISESWECGIKQPLSAIAQLFLNQRLWLIWRRQRSARFKPSLPIDELTNWADSLEYIFFRFSSRAATFNCVPLH